MNHWHQRAARTDGLECQKWAVIPFSREKFDAVDDSITQCGSYCPLPIQ